MEEPGARRKKSFFSIEYILNSDGHGKAKVCSTAGDSSPAEEEAAQPRRLPPADDNVDVDQRWRSWSADPAATATATATTSNDQHSTGKQHLANDYLAASCLQYGYATYLNYWPTVVARAPYFTLQGNSAGVSLLLVHTTIKD